MALWVGTSGFNYPEWKGSFYPEKISSKDMLPYYSARFDTVEINNTFYRMPTEKAVAAWAEITPERFKLTLKAPKLITHIKRLRECEEPVRRFLEVAATLGPKLGALLFQLPPFARKDVPLLEVFLALLPAGARVTFEFRHASWFDDETYAALRARNVALCVSDSEKLSAPVEVTADYAYFRLRDEGYKPDDIVQWARTIKAKTGSCKDVYVYFKHEESGTGPEFARQLLKAMG